MNTGTDLNKANHGGLVIEATHLGRAAQAVRMAAAGYNINGLPVLGELKVLPPWRELRPAMRAAYRAVAEAAIRAYMKK